MAEFNGKHLYMVSRFSGPKSIILYKWGRRLDATGSRVFTYQASKQWPGSIPGKDGKEEGGSRVWCRVSGLTAWETELGESLESKSLRSAWAAIARPHRA